MRWARKAAAASKTAAQTGCQRPGAIRSGQTFSICLLLRGFHGRPSWGWFSQQEVCNGGTDQRPVRRFPRVGDLKPHLVAADILERHLNPAVCQIKDIQNKIPLTLCVGGILSGTLITWVINVAALLGRLKTFIRISNSLADALFVLLPFLLGQWLWVWKSRPLFFQTG